MPGQQRKATKQEIEKHKKARPLFSAFDIKKATRLTKKEKWGFRFAKRQVFIDEIESTKTVFKVYKGKTLIISQWPIPRPGYNCRHKLEKL